MAKRETYLITILNWDKYNSKSKPHMPHIFLSKRFFDDAKIQKLPAGGKLLWLGLLLRRGDVDETFFEASYEDLVRFAGGSGQVVARLLSLLESLQLLTYEKVPSNIIESNIKEEKEREVNAPKRAPPSDPFYRKKFDPKILPKAGEIWNANCGSLIQLKATTRNWNDRSERLLLDYGEEEFTRAVTLAASNSFLSGGNKRKWRATFAWLIDEGNLGKVLNGDFDTESSLATFAAELEKALAS